MKGDSTIQLLYEAVALISGRRILLKRHQWIAMTLSLICTGLGMFYIGTPLMIIGAVLLMAAQGFGLYVFFLSLGFLGAIILPGMLLAHAAGVIISIVYFTRKPITPNGEQKRERQLAVPWKAAVRAAAGLGLFLGIICYGYDSSMAPFIKSPAEKEAAQDDVLDYLEQRYSERFKIKEVNYTWASSTYSMNVSPLDNPGLEFTVRADDEDPVIIEADDYLNRLWSSQLDLKLAGMVKELYPADSIFVNTFVYTNKDTEYGVIKQYDSLLNGSYPLHSQSVDMIIFADLASEEQFRTEKERVVELIRRMRGIMVASDINLSLEYYPKAAQTGKNVSKIKESFHAFGSDSEHTPTHKSYVPDINKVQSVRDLRITSVEHGTR